MVNPRKDNHSSSSIQETLFAQDPAAFSILDVLDDEVALLLLLTASPLTLAARLCCEMGHRAGLEHTGSTIVAREQHRNPGSPN